MFRFFKKKIKKIKDMDASEAFIDSKNLAGFDADRFEGVLERPINKNNFLGIFIIFNFILMIFLAKAYYMQGVNGEEYLTKSRGNFIKTSVLFSERGVVFDRNNKELVWNEKNINGEFAKRSYVDQVGFSHILGFLSYPQKDRSNRYFEKEYKGKSGVEKYFNNELNGKLGKRIIEINSRGKVVSENKLEHPTQGSNIILSIDYDIQKEMAFFLNDFIKKYNYKGASGIMMDVRTGEIISLVSLPEYDSNILTDGKDKNKIKDFIFDKNKPFLNRASLGEFAPGSIVKPFTALRALKDKIISPYEKIYTNGQLVLPNPYHPSKPSIFRDFHNNGSVDMKKAIAVSSNIYFYILGGGFQGRKGLGIKRLHENFSDFGFGTKTGIFGMKENKGVVPSVKWKKDIFGTNWNIGNTYYTAIGQFGFLTTPLQVAVGISAIANNGEVLVPQIIKNSKKEIKNTLEFSDESYKIVKDAMRQAVTSGTAKLLKFKDIKISAKTGTAERGVNREKINSWVTGFFPSDKPQYSFVFLAEDGSAKKIYVVSWAAHNFFKKISKNGSLDRLLGKQHD